MIAIGKKLRRAAEAQGLSAAEVARRVGISPERYGNYVRSQREPDYTTLREICRVLNVTPDYLLGFSEAPTAPGRPGNAPGAWLAEIDVRAGAGGGGEAMITYQPDGNGNQIEQDAVRAGWEIPDGYLRSELRVDPAAARIIEVVGDSMEPTLRSGDRVLINLADRTPSPPGVFALWDGFGVVVKRIEFVPHSDPATIRIISDNSHHPAYERTADEVNVIGRLAWMARRL